VKDTVVLFLFWVPLGFMVYHWALFPLLLWIVGMVRPRRYIRTDVLESPYVSIVMAVHNEELIIADKIRNCLALDYPSDRVEILVGSDASTDQTEEIIRAFADPRIHLMRFEPQAGKTVVQNRLLREAHGDVVLCTDADSLLTPGSLRLMLERMRDPRVAVVNPRYVRVGEDGSLAEGFYDRWETKVKELEGRLGAMVGCNAYANMLRRDVATPIPDDTNLDDFVLGIRPFRSGCDVVVEPRALVTTRVETERLEFRRKARINRGNLQAVLRFADLLHPRYGVKAWVYFSHKVIRMLIPFFLVAMLVASVVGASRPFFRFALAVQLLSLASIPLLLATGARWRKFLLPQYYYFMNAALLVGYWQFFANREKFWAKTPREPRYSR
jgi:cellulose synthase/poly-beta-1,6-N-acetylglucosamine synthase-like glycosyltransferase